MTTPAPPRFNFLALAPATCLMILINVGVYVWQGLAGGSWLHPTTEALFAWGGNLPVYTLTGDGWRLLTSMFLHVGLIHIALNMYVLLFTGPRVEMEFGSARMLAIYLAGGLIASCASTWWGDLHTFGGVGGRQVVQLTVGVGASGAVMALFGSLLALLVVPPPRAGVGAMRRPIDKGIIQVVAINLGMGFLVQGVDQAAHVGGLVGGVALGLLMAAAPRAVGAGAVAARFAGAAVLTAACVTALLHSGDKDRLLTLRHQLDEQNQSNP